MKKGSLARLLVVMLTIAVLSVALTGCSGVGDGTSTTGPKIEGKIRGDGSSTVFPLSEGIAEEFQIANKGVKVTVGLSGTGGGFKKFASGEIDFSNASREIKKEEADNAEKNGVEFIEFRVAFDGLSVLANPENDFVNDLTVGELNKIWEPGSKIVTWKDVRSEWPAEKIQLFGPGTDSGTFDYFTKEINGEEQASRSDYTASEDDNMLVQGISGNKYSLGYLGYSYYIENKAKLKLISVNGVSPGENTIRSGEYKPLSRPLYIYVNKNSLKRPEVKEFVKFYLENAAAIATEVGYVPMPDKEYQESLSKL